MVKRRQQEPRRVIDVRRIPELGRLEVAADGTLVIGAGVIGLALGFGAQALVLAGQAGAAVANTSATSAPGFNATAVDASGSALTSSRGVGAHLRRGLGPLALGGVHQSPQALVARQLSRGLVVDEGLHVVAAGAPCVARDVPRGLARA